MSKARRSTSRSTQKRPTRSSRVDGTSSSRKALDQAQARLLFIMALFAVCYVAIAARLFEVSVIGVVPDSRILKIVAAQEAKSEEEAILEDDGGGQELTDSELAAQPKRGDIVDRNGVVVATAIDTKSLYADAKILKKTNVDAALDGLKKLFPELNKDKLAKRIEKGGRFLYVKRHLAPEQQQAVMNLGIPGLGLQDDERRVYPQANMFAHVLGYVDIDNKGIAGLERHFDKRLRDEKKSIEPLKLSLDVRLQHILHEEMSAAVKEFSALGGAGLIADARTGEIVAMVSLPDFDPHFPARMIGEARFNRATLGVYEMGSTFKTFSVAMALKNKTVGLEGGYDTTKPIHVGRFTIDDSHPERRWLSVPEIFAYSSNIGTVKMALDVGVKKHQAFLKSLGLFDPITVELPERGSPMIPDPWREVNTMTISFGHGMSVTPVHLVRAIASLVSDGHLKNLTLIKEGNLGKQEGEEIVPMSVTESMRHLLRLVVEYGTARKANAPGYFVGGKTGTAEKVKGGKYAGKDKLASFVGVFPTHDPRYVVYVMIDEPRGTKKTFGFATGGWVAAPVVGNVVSRMGPLLGIQPDFQEDAGLKAPRWLQRARERLERDRH